MSLCLSQIKYEVISVALEGPVLCGNLFFVTELVDTTLIVVANGLGRGEEAFFAANKAIEIIEAHSHKSITELYELCNQALLETHGAAMTIAQLDSYYKLSYVALGNVAGACWHISSDVKKQTFFLQPGLVGASRLPNLQINEIMMAPGDTIILATDGIKSQFDREPPKLKSPEKFAQYIFNTYRKNNEDALVLVAQLR